MASETETGMKPYSDSIMEHFEEPRNRGTLPNADGVGVVGTPGGGPFIVIQVMLQDGKVHQAAFQCHNCGVTVASGSIITLLIQGRTLDECLQLTSAQVAAALDGVPAHKLHIPEFVVSALRLAVEDIRR